MQRNSVSAFSVFLHLARRVFRGLTISASVFVLLSCSGNFYEGMANKSSDAAIYEDGKKLLDSGSYDAALTKFLSLSSAYLQRSDVIENLSGAYAGRCGQDFITIVNNMGSSTAVPMLFFMRLFTSISVNPDDCYTAQTTLERLGASTQRTADQNFYMFVLGVSKIGTILKKYADDGTGSMAAGFNSCTITNTSTVGSTISKADIKQIITGLGLVFDNKSAVTSTVSGSTAMASLTAFQTACATATGITNCSVTDINDAALTDNVVNYFRELLRTSDIGITTACTSSQALPLAGTGSGSICCP